MGSRRAADLFTTAADALLRAGERNRVRLGQAIALVDASPVAWCGGLGKSGLVARKLADTLRSRGRRAIAVHPVDAFHGDLGGVGETDVLVAVSTSGRTAETLRLAREAGLPVLALCPEGTPLAALARVTLDTQVEVEAGGALPVTAFTVACALADALALGVSGGHHHPGGNIGAMARPVRGYMRPPPLVDPALPIAEVIPHLVDGAVLLAGGGIFTDGDLRRAVGADPRALSRPVGEFATASPVTIGPDEPAAAAVETMERRASQLSVLPVVEGGQYVGLVRLHDLVRAGMLP